MHNVPSMFTEDLPKDKMSDELFSVGPKFEMIASASLNLDNCSHDVETHELYVEDRQRNY